MTRRVALAGVAAVCLTALVVATIAYLLVQHGARTYEDRLLVQLAARPRLLLTPRANSTELAQITSPGGALRRQTAALAKLGKLPPLHRGFANVTLENRPLRVFTRLLAHRRSLLSIAVSDVAARDDLAALRRGVLIAMFAGALLASLALVTITRRALSPLRRTAEVADRIVSTGDLAARVPQAGGDDEIASLTRSLNRMLTHLEASDTALRRLVADASHELRSPVTTLRGNLELLRDARLDGADREEALRDAQAEAERLGRLVEDLLTLARVDTVNASERVVLAELVADVLAGSRARLESVPAGLAGAQVSGDTLALRTLVRNLVENAERYGGGAEVRLAGDEDWLELSVADHGPGVPEADRERIFGRFTRGAGTAILPGSGLGLAIVAATAAAHGGTVSLTETPGGGATFTVRLPHAE
ncbi:MAG: sensor histidine kinase [Solirubrobacteraceae bacterium]